MKRFAALACILCMLMTILVGCGGGSDKYTQDKIGKSSFKDKERQVVQHKGDGQVRQEDKEGYRHGARQFRYRRA